MSFETPSGDLSAFTEVVPESARLGGLTKSSILTQRRRCRVTPQTGPNYGSAGANGGGQQLQFLIADQGGLVDPRSIVLNYTIQTTGTNSVPDDGHCFSTVQVLMNGQLMDNIQNAMKLTNIEMKMGGSKSYYQTAGSFQGFEILNNDLTAVATPATTALSQWGYVSQNLADLAQRCQRSAAPQWNNIAGEQRSIPLGLVSGVGRMKQYIPISLLGELSLVLVTGSTGEVMFQNGTQADCGYSLSGVSLEYDVVVPDSRYMALLQKIASDPSDSGINLPFESSIVTAGAAIAASSSALTENTVIVSRATNHLLRASVVQILSSALQSQAFPSQSCFSHAGTWSYQMRIGSQVYPQISAQGDASMFNTSLLAYGAVTNENGALVNRALWGNSSTGASGVYETAQINTGGSVKYWGADSFVPSYGFAVCKGAAEPLDVDGVSLAGASGSQLIVSLVSAPYAAYTPYVALVALKFIKAAGGSVAVVGA